MKKQTRPQTIKEKKPSVPGEWLYIAPEGMTVRKIAACVADCGMEHSGDDQTTAGEPCKAVELWEAAGVLEIPMGERSTMDIEYTQVHPKDTFTQEFVAEHGYREVFLVTFEPEVYEQARVVMQDILSRCGGLFCGDTEDFSPVIRVEQEE